MENLKIDKTELTPEVLVDCNEGIIKINGICVPENSVEFFDPIVKRIDCISQSKTQIVFDICLEYFNTGASKSLLNLFLKVAEIEGVEIPTKVVWKIEEGDDELRESGEILKEISKLNFEFVEIPRS